VPRTFLSGRSFNASKYLQLADKVTGMLLESLETAELPCLIYSPPALDEKEKLTFEEIEVLHKHTRAPVNAAVHPPNVNPDHPLCPSLFVRMLAGNIFSRPSATMAKSTQSVYLATASLTSP
jgi:hypothetical protein